MNIRHEHRGPDLVFSVAALLQEQFRAFSLPQEHLAWAAQTQPPPGEVLQQVMAGWTILSCLMVFWVCGREIFDGSTVDWKSVDQSDNTRIQDQMD